MEKGDVPPHIKDAFAVLKGGAMDYIDGVETHGERDGNANFHNFQNALTGLI